MSLIQTQVTSFIEYLSASVCRRVENIPNPERGYVPCSSPRSTSLQIFKSGHSFLWWSRLHSACLSSSSVSPAFELRMTLTMSLCRYIPRDEPIDLVNVAFERPSSTTKHRSPRLEAGYNVPDRLSGLEATEELRAAYPEREWRFVEINVPYTVSAIASLVGMLLLTSVRNVRNTDQKSWI